MSFASKAPVIILPKCFCECYNMSAWEKTFKTDIWINNKPYSCGRCQKGFSPKNNEIVHNLIHTLNALKNLNILNENAITKMNLTTYNIIQADEKLCKVVNNANHCLSSEKVNNELNSPCEGLVSRSHVQFNKESLSGKKINSTSTKNSKDSPFPCLLGDKSLKKYNELSMHHSLHVNEEFHKCVESNRTFVHESDSVSHMHHEDYKIPCQSSVNFTHETALITDTHSNFNENGTNSYPCKICDSSFASREDVVKHMIVHAMENPWKCSICYKSFSSKSNFQTHLRVHSEEKPYACKVCQKSYKYRHSLNNHDCSFPYLI